ncbi:MAG: hypothetical protein WA463_01165 [Terriglobales bacterium]
MVDHIAPGAVALAAHDLNAAVLGGRERPATGAGARNRPQAAEKRQLSETNGFGFAARKAW